MNKIIRLSILAAVVVLAAVATLAAGCSGIPASNTQSPEDYLTTISPLPHSMKGYELYSWQVDDQWHFTLVTGTNRLKTFEEITAGEDVVNIDSWTRLSVQGLDELKSLLARLPAGEEIYWASELTPDSRIKLPPQDMIDAVQKYAEELGLQVLVGD